MTFLTLLLSIKIVVTFIVVVFPFLFLPRERVGKMISIELNNSLFIRLYGVAILALLVGYASSIPQSQLGEFPWGVIFMGLVSNAGASVLMLCLGGGIQSKVMGVFFGVVAVLLVIAMGFPDAAVKNIW